MQYIIINIIRFLILWHWKELKYTENIEIYTGNDLIIYNYNNFIWFSFSEVQGWLSLDEEWLFYHIS